MIVIDVTGWLWKNGQCFCDEGDNDCVKCNGDGDGSDGH